MANPETSACVRAKIASLSSSARGNELASMDTLPQHLPELRSFIATRTQDPWAVDDIAQETIARTCKSAKLTELTHPLAYMISVAKAVMIDRWRALPDYDMSTDVDTLASSDKTLEQRHIDEEKVEAVASALNKMPPLRRKVFEMRRVHGMSRSDIASELNLNTEAVKKHINRAIVDITLHMEKHGWNH